MVSLCLSCQLKRVKTYLRSSTGEARLNYLMLLHVHKDLADGTDIVEIANLFVGDNQWRNHWFAKFSQYHLSTKSVSVLPLRQLWQSKMTTKSLWKAAGDEKLSGFKIQRPNPPLCASRPLPPPAPIFSRLATALRKLRLEEWMNVIIHSRLWVVAD